MNYLLIIETMVVRENSRTQAYLLLKEEVVLRLCNSAPCLTKKALHGHVKLGWIGTLLVNAKGAYFL